MKIFLDTANLKEIREAASLGVVDGITTNPSPAKALLPAKAGARFVSPFVGRLDDVSSPGMEVVADIVQIFRQHRFDCEILAASLRHPMHVVEAAKLGADIGTMPVAVFHALVKHPLTDVGLERFLEDWEKAKRELAARAGR